jgi:hypothetical protein
MNENITYELSASTMLRDFADLMKTKTISD